MKMRFIFFLLLLSIYYLGCRRSENMQQERDQAEVKSAVKTAFGLEQQLWDHKANFRTRKQVYNHYRQGFSDELAESLTSYTWSEGELRATEKTMEIPDTVHIISISKEKATVYYKTPEDLRTIWQLKSYTINYLRREENRWIIYKSSESDTIPVEISE